jgi:FtsZ-binding cell division protein ZapB
MSTEDLTALLEEADATADPSVPADRLANGGALIQRLARALKESKAEAATLRAERDRLTAERDRLRVQANDLRETQANWDEGTRHLWGLVEKAETERDALLAWLRSKPESAKDRPPGWCWKDDVTPEMAARAHVLASLIGRLTDERARAERDRLTGAEMRATMEGVLRNILRLSALPGAERSLSPEDAPLIAAAIMSLLKGEGR